MAQESIIDASKPSPGRMYDYFLGGHHNFEVDRKAGDQLLSLLPFVSKFVRMQRWTLQDLATILTVERGYDVIIDYASGLPTADNIHTKVPPGTTVIYSDYDSVIVEYAKEILGKENNHKVNYFHVDAGRPEDLLNQPDVKQTLGDRRKVAFVYWGVSGFLSDEALSHAAQVLYEWAAPGSCLAFNAHVGADTEHFTPAVQQTVALYKAMGTTLYIRKPDDYLRILKPWELDSQGWVPLLKWHGFDQSELGQEDESAFGPLGGGLGGFFVKP
ncbi:MAG: hypothetical protein EHM41_14555 [Chloroflexi bacterium]|nr:MAG: hypothetical protein EHM41_14555 [Chloroflexota bacterium]